jgi:Protein of unknown function (DUF2721)
MLAYTNRFLALATVVRNLHDRYRAQTNDGKMVLHAQIKHLRFRLKLIRRMQLLGVLSFLLAIVSMSLIYVQAVMWAEAVFASSLVVFACSLVLSMVELSQSTRSLEIELSDMEGLEDPGLMDYLRRKWQGQ